MKKVILVGDPKQLPATTFSHLSERNLYNRSLFERILENGR
jgi:senataxin